MVTSGQDLIGTELESFYRKFKGSQLKSRHTRTSENQKM
jgi:hypothetical protein